MVMSEKLQVAIEVTEIKHITTMSLYVTFLVLALSP